MNLKSNFITLHFFFFLHFAFLEIQMEKLKINSFFIEFLPRILAGNVYIKFSGLLEKYQTKVHLNSDKIIINVDDEEYIVEISDFFSIDVKTFYNLLVKDESISFRFISASNEKRFDAENITGKSNGEKSQKLELHIKENENCNIECSNCGSQLTITKEITIKRIRELPSSSMAISDWFCHREDNEKIFNSSSNGHSEGEHIHDQHECFNEKTLTFEPKIGDIFYGPFHLLMNKQNFEMSRFRQKKSSNMMHCKRCLQLICQSNASFLAFWWENIKFNGRLMYNNVNEPIDLIVRVILNHLSCDSLMYLSPIVKIIFEATVPSTGQKIHILLQIMDKNLKLLKLNLDNFKLMQVSSIKVMYLRLNYDKSDDDVRTLKYWQKDINTMTFEFSFKMYHAFCEYLEKQSDIIPKNYRHNNSFQLSYIELV